MVLEAEATAQDGRGPTEMDAREHEGKLWVTGAGRTEGEPRLDKLDKLDSKLRV